MVDSQRGSKKHYTNNLKYSYEDTYVVNELRKESTVPFHSHKLWQHNEYLDGDCINLSKWNFLFENQQMHYYTSLYTV